MEGQHAVKLTAERLATATVLLKNIDEHGKGTVSRDWVSRDAAKIAAAIGLTVYPRWNKRDCCCGNHRRTSVHDRTDDAGAARRARRQRGGCHCAGGETGRRLPPHGGNALAQYQEHEPDGECIDALIFVKNGPCIAGLGLGRGGWTTMTITANR